jgi:hypothetical protein
VFEDCDSVRAEVLARVDLQVRVEVGAVNGAVKTAVDAVNGAVKSNAVKMP